MLTPSSPIVLHSPEYIRPDPGERHMVERIFISYQQMKKDQEQAPACYAPSSLWRSQLEQAYGDLIAGWKGNDIERFHFFLANFGAWKTYLGLESSPFIGECARSRLKRRYMQRDVFERQLKIWRWFQGDEKPLSRLSYPTHGNQAGAFIDGVFVGVGSFFNEVYGSLLCGLVAHRPRPVVAELGAGYGKLAHFLLRDLTDFTYVDFDLPETLCVAAYYLIKAFPGRRSVLYGEAEYGPEAHDRYDLIFMPGFLISRLAPRSVDLFVNKNSLGEMTREGAAHYVAQITRATRQYFFHMNHDVRPCLFEDGQRGLLGREYPLPEDQFRLLVRYPDLGHMVYRGSLDFDQDVFFYLYLRRDAEGSSEQAGGGR